ncbi:plasmolipin isoform X3 [Tursiops truncatus]|uniref:Plasmolipin isoform X3 n=1 Tax=Tursiops truncatus TaxID=9739 RepID=A0A6J3QDY3_TURTR|nr:plasmolipin isoform X3 [Tursiops truncatus]
MAEFPSKVSTRTSSPAQGGSAAVSALRPDLGFVRSSLGALMLLQLCMPEEVLLGPQRVWKDRGDEVWFCIVGTRQHDGMEACKDPALSAGAAGVGPDCRHLVPPVPGLWLGDVCRCLPLAGDNRLLHPLPVSAAHEAIHGALAAGGESG